MDKKAIMIFLILATGLLTAQDVNFNNKLRLAQSYERSGQFEKAVEKYKELLSQQPFNRNILQSLNEIYLGLKQYDKSISLVSEELAKSPHDISLSGMLGSTYYVMGEESKAYSIWDNALEKNKNSAAGYRVIANAAITQRAFEKAAEVLKAGKENTSNPSLFQHDLAQIYNIQMKYGEATREYCELLKSDSNQINLVKQKIAGYLESHGAFEKSIKIVEEFAEESGEPVYFDLLSGLYIRMGEFEQAYKVIRELDTQKLNKSNLLYNFANNAMREGEFDIAARAFRDFVERNDDSNITAAARINYAAALKGSADKHRANVKEWKNYIKPDSSGAWKYEKAVKAYEELTVRYEKQLTAYQAYYRMGVVYQEVYLDYTKAESLYQNVVTKMPLSDIAGNSWLRLGQIAIIRGDFRTAEKSFSDALFSPRARQEIKDQAKYELGKLKLWQNDFEKSASFFMQLASNPANDFANDALNYSIIINSFKKDSVSLSIFAKAEMEAERYNFDSAAVLYGNLSSNPNLMLLNEMAQVKKGEMLLAAGKLNEAIDVFDNIISDDAKSSYKDEAMFILAEIYRNELKNKEMATELHEKLLEKFPRSLYLDKSREIINALNINKNKTI